MQFTISPEKDYRKSKIVIVPVPYDGTSTWMKGADKGPKALHGASTKLELYDIETDSQVYKKGIYTAAAVCEKSSPEKMVKAVEKKTASLLKDGKFVVTIGGEHSVSIGAIKVHCDKYPGLGVLQLDAHADFQNELNGSQYNHGCVMKRVNEFCPNIVQVGIRSMAAEEKKNLNPKNVFFAEDIHDNTDWVSKVVAKLPTKVYITIDLDVFDPSIMPSTGTPEPGGLLWYDVLELLRDVIQKKELVGFDVVELCPNERNKSPDFMAAKLIYKVLSYKFCGK